MTKLTKTERRAALIKEVKTLLSTLEENEELLSDNEGDNDNDKRLFNNYITIDADIHCEDPLFTLMNYIGQCTDEGSIIVNSTGDQLYLVDEDVNADVPLNVTAPLYIFGLDDLEFALRHLVQRSIRSIIGSLDPPYHSMSLRKIRFAFDAKNNSAFIVRLIELKTSVIEEMKNRLQRKKYNADCDVDVDVDVTTDSNK